MKIPMMRDLALCVTEYQTTLDTGFNMAVCEMMASPVRWYFIAMGCGAPPLVIPCATEEDIDRALRVAMMGAPDAACLDDMDEDMVPGIVADLLNVEFHGLEDGEFYLAPVKPVASHG
jgi:hypothetical protein